MKEQITRARYFYKLAEEGASELDKASRWPVTKKILWNKLRINPSNEDSQLQQKQDSSLKIIDTVNDMHAGVDSLDNVSKNLGCHTR